jgi:menaquinone-specific isochorismate synthase
VRLEVRTVAIDDGRALLDLLPDGPSQERFAFVRDGEGLVAWGVAQRFSPGSGGARFERAESQFAALAAGARIEDEVERFGTGLVAFGSFAFDDTSDESVLVVPRVIVGRRDGITWRTTISATSGDGLPQEPAAEVARQRAPDPSDVRPRFAGSSLREEEWLAAVASAIDAIGRGELEKVVLARDQLLWARSDFALLPLLARLAARFPSCSTFLVDGLLGASPELLLSRRGSHVASQILAGTAARGGTRAEDEALASALSSSAKDLLEHRLAVESVVGVLAPRCTRHTVPERPELLLLDNVQHLASRFEGELRDVDTSLRILGGLHPTAAVGGTPRPEALALIRTLEGMGRDRYAAPVGWASASGDGEWAIALRCGHFEGARARLYAGAGIVAGSLPEQELQETWLKLRAMREVIEA